MIVRCPKCHGAGWQKPQDDDRHVLQRMTFIRCEECDNGRVQTAEAISAVEMPV
jgi:hypothetical protein